MSELMDEIGHVADVLYQNKYFTTQDKEVIQSQKSEWLSFLALKSILSGIKGEKLKRILSEKLQPDEALGLYTVTMTDLFRDNDALAKEITDATEKAKESLAEYDEMKKFFVEEIKAPYENERENYKKQLAGKDEFIALMQKDHDKLEETNKKLEVQLWDQQKFIAELQDTVKRQYAEILKHASKTALQEKQEMPCGFFSRKTTKKNQADLEHFVNDVLSDKSCDEAHQAFLMSCLEQGYSVDEIERYFSNNKWSIELLERFRDFYAAKVKGI